MASDTVNSTAGSEFAILPLTGTPWDYSNRDNWMYFDDSNLIQHEVDTFFLYPTSVVAEVKEDFCSSIDQMVHNAHVNYLMDADVLAPFTNMYAPYYRQMSLAGILKNPTADSFLEALKNNITRTDVYAALDYYFENCNNGRPFILAGHSQGSCNLKIVMSEYMRLHPEYLERMVACYAIGFYFPDSWFEENPHVKKAEGETDTGVLITWNTEGPDVTSYNMTVGSNDGFCINPLNWKTDETPADISENRGSVFVDGDVARQVYDFASNRKFKRKFMAVSPAEIAMEHSEGVADARIDRKRGALITTAYTDYLPPNQLFGDRSCHLEDWSLFSENIGDNARARIREYLKKSRKPFRE